MIKNKIKIAFFTRKRNGALKICEDNIITHLQNINNFNVKVHVLPYSNNLIIQLFYLIKIFFRLWGIYRENDIVNMYAVCNYFVILNPILKKLLPSTISVAFLAHFENTEKGNIQKLLEYSWKSFDYYISMSDYSKKQFLDLYPLANVKTIYLGVDNKFKPQPRSDFSAYKYILYVGDEYKRKNIETILKAFVYIKSEFDNIKFVKIGQAASESDSIRIDNEISRLGLSNDIIIKREFISDDELILYYSNAEFLVSPSSLEGFGLPVIEACKCKCIPLLSSIPTYQEFCLPKCLYVEDYMNKEAWEQSIKRLLLMTQEQKMQLKKDVKVASHQFTWKNNATQTANYYLEILKKQKEI